MIYCPTSINIIKRSEFSFNRIQPVKKHLPPKKPLPKPPIKYDDYREKLNLNKWKKTPTI